MRIIFDTAESDNNNNTNTTTISTSIPAVAVAATATTTSEESCLNIKRDGTRCQRIPTPGESFCHFHKGTCIAITSKGLKCSNGCMEHEQFCVYHAGTCPGKTKSGEPCRLAREFCRYHQDLRISTSTTVSASTTASASDDPRPPQKHQCQGLTQKGHQCRRQVPSDQEYCHFHS
jgi:hypothetical protein